jgi:hypothetical protein
VQRIALQDETGLPVARDAWVVVQSSTTGARRAHRVTLLGVNEIETMRDRYATISRGQVRDPVPARSSRQCETCGHRDRCVATFGARGTTDGDARGGCAVVPFSRSTRS